MQSRDCNFWQILTATFNILQSHFELWLQFSTFCSHISNYDCKMLKVAVTWLQISKCDRKMLKIAVIIRNVIATFNILQSHFEIWSHVTATFVMWLQFLKICSHVTATFELWLQNSKSDRKIRKYDNKFWKMTAIF